METRKVILELRTKRGLSQDELAEKVMARGRRYLGGKMVRQFQTQKLSNFYPRNLMFRSTHCLVSQESLSASAAECRLKMIRS